MNIEDLYNFCLSLPDAYDTMPFGDDCVVFKVNEKMFALLNINQKPIKISCKVLPDRNIELQERYNDVEPGFHLNKKHWATLTVGGDFSDDNIKLLIEDSYKLVFKPKK